MIPKGNVERALVALVVANLALVSSQVHATTDLDSSFGNGGRVVTDVSGRYDEARALAIQADGRIVAAGVTGTGSNEGFALVRYKTDGALDRTFGVGGTVITDVSRGSDAVWAVAIQSDGKIWLPVSRVVNFHAGSIQRHGTLDPQFGNGGTITTDFGGDDKANALALQRDGQIVVAGVAGGRDFALARYRTDGTLDATFGTEGKVTTDFSDNADVAFALAIQRDGMIVAAGATGEFPTEAFALARYNADGSLDAGFGAGGRVMIEFGRDARAHTLAIQSDGKIVTGGFVNNGSSGDGALARHNADGTVDRAFGTAGRVVTDFGGRKFGSALAIQSDGKIIVAGSDDFPPYYDFALARYEPDGSREVNSSRDGTVLTEFGGNSWINAVAVQSDGKVVAVGYARPSSSADFALVRYDSGR